MTKGCSSYDPCAWKDEGDSCTICDPADKDCKEPDSGTAFSSCDGEFPDWRSGNAMGKAARTVCEDLKMPAGTTTVEFQYKYVVGQYSVVCGGPRVWTRV